MLTHFGLSPCEYTVLQAAHTLTISLVVVNAVEIVVIIRLQLNMICYGGILWPKNGVT